MMNRRNFLKTVGAMLPAATITERTGAAQQTPNMLWLQADDAGWNDFGCYGHPVIRTPNIDQLADEGIRYTNAFVTTPQCSPSRTSTFTGKYAHTMGTEDLHTPLPKAELIVPEYLKEKEYYSGSVGKFHMGKHARKKVDYFSSRVTSWKKFLNNRPKDRPFFLTLGYHEPHRPYEREQADLQYHPEEAAVPRYLPESKRVKLDLDRYYTEITRMDRRIGRIMRYLQNNALDENTLVVFWSDNGSPFPRAKGFLYDAGIGTPLILRWKGTLKPGIRSELVSLIDLAPTMLDAASISKPGEMVGYSLLPQLENEGADSRDYIFTERNWHDIDDHIRSVRTRRYKYTKNFYPWEPFGLPADVFGSPSFKAMRQLKKKDTLKEELRELFRWPRPEEELYDLTTDPNEFNNVADDPAYQEVLTKLREKTREWEQQTDDVSPEKRKPNRSNYMEKISWS